MKNAGHGGPAPEVQGSDLDTQHPSATRDPTAKHHEPALSEPVVVARFWKNRRGESVQATLLTYEGRNCFDLRQFYTTPAGKHVPTRKGITIAVLRLPEMADAVNKSIQRARQLGLIDDAEKTP